MRENIARYLWDFRGMSVRSEQIIVGAGTEYLYGLLIQLLGNDKVYGVENPGYRKLEKIYGSYGVPCEWISMDEAGILVQELEEKISALTSEMSSGSGDNGAFDEGGGTGSMEEPEQPKSVPEYILVIAAVCVIAAGWTIYKKKRGGRRWDV